VNDLQESNFFYRLLPTKMTLFTYPEYYIKTCDAVHDKVPNHASRCCHKFTSRQAEVESRQNEKS